MHSWAYQLQPPVEGWDPWGTLAPHCSSAAQGTQARRLRAEKGVTWCKKRTWASRTEMTPESFLVPCGDNTREHFWSTVLPLVAADIYQSFSSTWSGLWLLTWCGPGLLKTDTQVKNTPWFNKTHSGYVETSSHDSENKTKSDFLSKYTFGRLCIDKKYLPFKWKIWKIWATSKPWNMDLLHGAWMYSGCISGWDLRVYLVRHYYPLSATASSFHWMKMWVRDQERIYWALWLFMRAGLFEHTIKHT